jgi:hypothetical protein
VQAGASNECILEETAASFQLSASTADEVLAAAMQAGASTKFILEEALTDKQVLAAPVQAGGSNECILEEAAASLELLACR